MIGALDGGVLILHVDFKRKPNVALSNLRNAHVALSNLRNVPFALSNLRNVHVPCH